MFRPGDRALIKKIHGFKVIQEAICWWTNSQFSHIEPILDSSGMSLDITLPKAKLNNINNYFDGNWRVVILRPVPAFTMAQEAAWISAVKELEGRKYDWRSYFGFLSNKRIEDKERVNCAEGVLYADHRAGILTGHDGFFITPQSYYDFMVAGRFEVVSVI